MKLVFARKAPWWFAILIILICTLIGMLLVRYTRWGQRVVNAASVVVWPFQEMVAQPAVGVKHLFSICKAEVLCYKKINVYMQKCSCCKRSCSVYCLTKAKQAAKSVVIVFSRVRWIAHLLAVDLSPALHQVIDKGSNAHLYVGQRC